MPIKVRSTFKKQEFEYVSPDGDTWLINYVETEGRKYVQIGREGTEEKDFAIWDVAMLLDIADQIRGMSSILKSKPGVRGLQAPNISDHRMSGLPQAEQIENSVANTMSNFDNKSKPLESFSPSKKSDQADWSNFRTGVDISSQQPVGETPEDFKKQKGSPDWVERPKTVPRPNVTRGASGDTFKRVSAADIL